MRGNLRPELYITRRTFIACMLASSSHFQILNLETLHRTIRPSSAFDSSICHDVPLATCVQRRENNRNSSLFLQILDARLFFALLVYCVMRHSRPERSLNRSLADAFLWFGHWVHVCPRTWERTLLSSYSDQVEVVSPHSDCDFFDHVFRCVHVVRSIGRIPLPFRFIQVDWHGDEHRNSFGRKMAI